MVLSLVNYFLTRTPISIAVMVMLMSLMLINPASLFSSSEHSTDSKPLSEYVLYQNTQVRPTTPGFTTYEDPTYGIAISYPSNWAKEGTRDYNYGTSILALAPPNTANATAAGNGDGHIGFATGVGLWISDLFEDGQSLDEYLSDLIGYHNETREDNKVFGSNTNARLGARPAYYLIEENKEGWETKNMMVGTILDGDKILEIEYAALPQDYDRYLPIVNQIISSLRFIDDQQLGEESSEEENKDGNEEEETGDLE